MIIYKKTDECYIEWQRMTTNDKEWQRVAQRVTTNDNQWYNEWQKVTRNDNEWQRVTTSSRTSDREWQRMIQRVTANGNEWQRVTAVVQHLKMAQYTSKNGWLPSFQRQKQIHYYFKGGMASIKVVK